MEYSCEEKLCPVPSNLVTENVFSSLTWNGDSVYQVRLARLHHFPKVNVSLEASGKIPVFKEINSQWQGMGCECTVHGLWAALPAEVGAVRQGSLNFKSAGKGTVNLPETWGTCSICQQEMEPGLSTLLMVLPVPRAFQSLIFYHPVPCTLIILS